MSTLKLRPWPFEDNEEIELYWHGSPYLNSEGLWMIRCLFKSEKDLFKEVAFPFGTLPHLRIGQFYKDGEISERPGKGQLFEIKVSLGVSETIAISKGFDFPKSLYAFDKRPAPAYGNLPLCKFEIKGNFYYIPCTEIIRSILAPYKAFANQLLRPEGLECFIESFITDEDRLTINFNEEFPLNLLRDDIVSYLVWLKFDQAAARSWNSVYNNLLLDSSKESNDVNELRKGIPIRVIPPICETSVWTFRGLSYKNHTLILELLYRSNLNMPFNVIEYYHPKLEKIESDNKPRYKKDPDKTYLNNDDVELDNTGQGAEKKPNLKTVEQPPIRFGFNRKPRVYRKRSKTHNVHRGKVVIIGQQKYDDENDNNVGTTQDWVRGGKISQIEFSTLEMVDISLSKGLEDFLLMLNHMQSHNKELEMSLSFVLLPQSKRFSYYEDGSLRTCAIACIEPQGYLPYYLLELGRADQWSISTLIVKPAKSENGELNEIEKLIQRLLWNMVNNGGHWDKEQLRDEKGYIFKTAKHISGQPILRWAERILEKLYYLCVIS